MIQTSSSIILDRSRLETLLTELSPVKFSSSEYNLAERLSALIGMSGSVSLAQSLNQLPTQVGLTDTPAMSTPQDDLVSTCKKMMLVITSSFVAEEGAEYQDAQLKAPSLNGLRLDALQEYTPFQRFYTAHQTEMTLGLQALRLRTRTHLASMSIELNQLAELDEILEDSLAADTRRLFTIIPKLLEQRFHFLLTKYQQTPNDHNHGEDVLEQWLLPDGWLTLFYHDLRELLLAEFNLRLQPILGLIEALNEQRNYHD